MNARHAGTREMTTATGTDAVALLLAYLLGRGVAAMPPGVIADVPASP